jgi:hypothetical protein
MKQTAVEYLRDKLLINDCISVPSNFWYEYLEVIKKAKEIEKEQICDAFYFGVKVDEWTIENPYTQAEKYYKENYNK